MAETILNVLLVILIIAAVILVVLYFGKQASEAPA